MNVCLTKKIKRNKSSRFTKKRRPYKKYLKAPWKWIDIFAEINLLKLINKKGFF